MERKMANKLRTNGCKGFYTLSSALSLSLCPSLPHAFMHTYVRTCIHPHIDVRARSSIDKNYTVMLPPEVFCLLPCFPAVAPCALAARVIPRLRSCKGILVTRVLAETFLLIIILCNFGETWLRGLELVQKLGLDHDGYLTTAGLYGKDWDSLYTCNLRLVAAALYCTISLSEHRAQGNQQHPNCCSVLRPLPPGAHLLPQHPGCNMLLTLNPHPQS